MGETTGIGWTEATYNPWMGCRSVSPGCHHCYARTLVTNRMGRDFSKVVPTGPATFNAPLRWKKPMRIFTCSISDFFIEEADAWREEVWDIIRRTPQHTYQILTKRPQRIKECLPSDWGEGYSNVWLGTSVEDQKRAEERIPLLVDVPAKVRFLSCEPLLGPLDLVNPPLREVVVKGKPVIHWIIIGGESGPDCRLMEVDWVWNLLNTGRFLGAKLYLKQLGGHPDKRDHEKAVVMVNGVPHRWTEYPEVPA